MYFGLIVPAYGLYFNIPQAPQVLLILITQAMLTLRPRLSRHTAMTVRSQLCSFS